MINIPNEPREQEAVHRACAAYANSSTLQLFDRHTRPASEQPMQALASGVLLSFAEHDLVVTASHVLDSPAVQRSGVYIFDDHRGFIDLGEFSFVRTASSGDRRVDDEIDLAILILEPQVGVHLRSVAGLRFTTLEQTEHEGPTVSCLHFIHGYPIGLTTNDEPSRIDRVALNCFLPLSEDSAAVWPSSHPDAHLDLEYQPDEVARVIGKRANLVLPAPQGFSGCGVWRVAVPSERSDSAEPAISLAGIVHRFNAVHSLLRATRLDALLALLLQDGEAHE